MKNNLGDPRLEKIVKAVTEMSKGLKAVAFYPENHPSLNAILQKICESFDAIPPPEKGLEISVSKTDLLIDEQKLSERHEAVSDFRNALFVNRTKKLIILPGTTPLEMMNFLEAVNVDPDEILKKGGLQRILIGKRIARIWINKVEYDKLMEELKKEQEHKAQEEEFVVIDKSPAESEVDIEEEDIETLLKSLRQTTVSDLYRDLVQRISRRINELIKNQLLLYAEKAIKIYAHHIEYPPGEDRVMADLAAGGILEVTNDDIIDLYVKKFGSKSLQERMEAQTVLMVLGEVGVAKLLIALTEEKNIIVRKAMVELITKMGDPAVPYIIKYLNDERWYVVRNMVTILGGIENEEVASYIASTLQNKDIRVKKEAIKALSKNPSPDATTALGGCCFDSDENITTIAVSSLGRKKDDKAVQILEERFHKKKFIYPEYRVSLEIIESLKNIGTNRAVSALEKIATYNPLFKPKRMKELKSAAVQGIGRVKSEKAREVLEKLSRSSDIICKREASKSLQRLDDGKAGT